MRAAVLGSPIEHSLSPVLHRAAYVELGLQGWRYEARECTAEQLSGVLGELDENWAGLSLTMPLKAAVIPLLDRVSPLAELVGAVNTVVPRTEGWVGENTDVPGLGEVFAAEGLAGVGSAVLLGAGATARSALAALSEVTAQVTVLARSPERAADLPALGAALGVEVELLPWPSAEALLPAAELVVSTVPAGATDQLPAGSGTLVDVVYAPWPTALAERWTGHVVGGLELLVQQAALQVELMTGAGAPVEAMRAAGEAALRER